MWYFYTSIVADVWLNLPIRILKSKINVNFAYMNYTMHDKLLKLHACALDMLEIESSTNHLQIRENQGPLSENLRLWYRARIFDGRKMLRYDEWLIYSIKCLGMCYRHIQKIGKLVWLLSENLELYVRQPKLYVNTSKI